MASKDMTKAVLTDRQFWIPMAVLAVGIMLLISIH